MGRRNDFVSDVSFTKRNLNDVLGERSRIKCKKHHRKRRTIEVDEVLGVGEGNAQLEVRIPIIPPAFEVLTNQIEKTVIFDHLIAGCGKVFINARLVKDIPFKTREKVVNFNCNSLNRLTLGQIRHVTAEANFMVCINLPEARKGDRVVVLDFRVDSAEIPNGRFPDTLTSCLIEKDCIWVKVKVVRDAIISVDTHDC